MRKVLFVSSFSGSSAYIASLLEGGFPFDHMVAANKVGSVEFAGRNVRVDYDLRSYKVDAQYILNKVKPDAVFTVSQFFNEVEKDFIKASMESGIQTFNAIDHWSFYLERFSLVDEDCHIIKRAEFLTDHILVNDHVALEESLAAGLPRERVVVCGNPVLEAMSVSALLAPLRKQWLSAEGLPDASIIIFFSEEIQRDFRKGSPAYKGYDEYEVIEHIIGLMGADQYLLIKMHPAEPENKYDFLKEHPRVRVTCQSDKMGLFKHAEVIIGMESMALLEAATLRQDIISYRPGATQDFIGDKVNATYPVRGKEELGDIIAGRKKVVNAGFGDRFKGSRKRIIDFLEKNIR